MINESKNIKNESINQITRDNVLALDIAEHCGYYSTHESGTWNFTQRKGKNATEQHKMFYDTLVEKRTLKLPERIRGVLRCKNPRCITSVEQELPQEFVLTDREKRVYRCIYCEQELQVKPE